MAQTTSVLWTEQSLDDDKKAQARENIGAGTGGSNVMFSNVLGGADNSLANMQISLNRQNDPTTIEYYDMSVTNSNSNNKSFALLPTDMDDGMVVMSNGHAEVKDIPEDGDAHYNLYKDYDCSYGGNTTKQDVIYLSEPAYNVRGFVSVMPENGGASIMPLSAGQTDIATYTGSWDKTSNNINNYGMPTDSYTFIPFAWTTDYPIVAIGIKGNGVVNKGHAFVETIK